MVWFWYIPYKPNGYDFIKTVGFGYGLVYNRINRTKPIKSRNMQICTYFITSHENLFVI